MLYLYTSSIWVGTSGQKFSKIPKSTFGLKSAFWALWQGQNLTIVKTFIDLSILENSPDPSGWKLCCQIHVVIAPTSLRKTGFLRNRPADQKTKLCRTTAIHHTCIFTFVIFWSVLLFGNIRHYEGKNRHTVLLCLWWYINTCMLSLESWPKLFIRPEEFWTYKKIQINEKF